MIDQNQIARLLEFLSSSKKIFLLFAGTQHIDLLLVTLACYLFFQDLSALSKKKSLLKEVIIFSPKKIKPIINKYPKVAEYLANHDLLNICQHDLGRENLLISFPYLPEQVDRVSYHIADNNQRFYLTIKPKKGSLPLDHQAVEFNYVGSSADLLILFGVNDLKDLKDLYLTNQELYQNTPLVTINNFLPDFGTLNLDISGSSCYGEAIFYLIKSIANSLNIELSSLKNIHSIATLLLSSISLKTNDFSHTKMTADSFLAVAELLQLGAERINLNTA